MKPYYSERRADLLCTLGYTAGLFRVPMRHHPFTPWREPPPHPVFLYGGVTPGKVSDRMRALCSRFPRSIGAVLFGGDTFWPRLRQYAGVPLWRMASGPHVPGAWPYVSATPGLVGQKLDRLQGWLIDGPGWFMQRELWRLTLQESPLPVFLAGPTSTQVARLFGEVAPYLGDR